MRKLFIIGLFIGIVALLVLITRMLLVPSTPPTPGEVTPVFPVEEQTPREIVTSEQYALPTNTGTISIRNFLQATDVRPDTMNPGFYHFEDSTNASYSIQYIAQTGHFTIALMKTPFAEAREKAENDIKARTGLSNEQLCNDLRYTVAVPAFVSVEYSGTDYRFSFCPDAVPL